jgi:hypothetical protein
MHEVVVMAESTAVATVMRIWRIFFQSELFIKLRIKN